MTKQAKREYMIKQTDRLFALLNENPETPEEKAANHLEQIICSIEPGSRRWMQGYVSSLRRAIAALKPTCKYCHGSGMVGSYDDKRRCFSDGPCPICKGRGYERK